MKKIINISVAVLSLAFICLSLFTYLTLNEAGEGLVENNKILEEVIQLLSYNLLLLIGIIALQFLKIYSKNKVVEMQLENLGLVPEERKEEVIIEKEISIEDKLKPVVQNFAEELKKLKSADRLNAVLKLIMNTAQADVGLLYRSEPKQMVVVASYAHVFEEEEDKIFSKTEGMIGQVVKSLKSLNISNIPEGYVNIITGLGESSPKSILILPIVIKDKLIGIIEIAALKQFSKFDEQLLEQLCSLIAKEIKSNE